jgi:hypothetical protein
MRSSYAIDDLPSCGGQIFSVKTWQDVECQHCGSSFDLERHEARMAPDVPLVVSDSEAPYAIMDDAGTINALIASINIVMKRRRKRRIPAYSRR